jgi:pyrroloquinoline quinone biosynthesis protein B
MIRIHVLGSAAGGGFPQWNCNCRNCQGVRRGEIKATARTQSSIAITSNQTDWVLFNASPDIRIQLESFAELQPARAVRDTAICAVVLIDAQIDHTTGLVVLREKGSPLPVYCTELVYQDLTQGYPLLKLLEHYCGVDYCTIPVTGESFRIPGADNLEFTAVALTSEAPPYSPRRHNPQPGDNIGMQVTDTTTGKNLFYAPGLGRVEPQIQRYLAEADCLLIDGTCWTDDEMVRQGISRKLASDMGHLAQSGENGMISVLQPLSRPRKVLIHINNTNPILDEDSQERAVLQQAGIEVAYDGMDISL